MNTEKRKKAMYSLLGIGLTLMVATFLHDTQIVTCGGIDICPGMAALVWAPQGYIIGLIIIGAGIYIGKFMK